MKEIYYRQTKFPAFTLYNDNEIFKQYPFNDKYLISNYGRIYCKRGYLVRQFINRNGYIECKLDRENKLVHRLVLLTFDFNKKYNSLDVNHKDGNKQNNFIKNLEWCTRKENIAHSIRNGLTCVGEQHPNSTHKNSDIHKICKYLEDGKSTKEISILLDIPYDKLFIKFISKIRTRKSWMHISKFYKF